MCQHCKAIGRQGPCEHILLVLAQSPSSSKITGSQHGDLNDSTPGITPPRISALLRLHKLSPLVFLRDSLLCSGGNMKHPEAFVG
ncbi:hypothetical protein KUCAC02_020309, partial [Chaenocephalus aceratus]